MNTFCVWGTCTYMLSACLSFYASIECTYFILMSYDVLMIRILFQFSQPFHTYIYHSDFYIFLVINLLQVDLKASRCLDTVLSQCDIQSLLSFTDLITSYLGSLIKSLVSAILTFLALSCSSLLLFLVLALNYGCTIDMEKAPKSTETIGRMTRL